VTATVQDERSWFARHAIDVRPLRHAAYRRLFIGNGVSFFGYQFTAVAVPVQVYRLTHSNLWVGMVSFGGLLPLIAFSLWGGAIADRFDRRRVLMVGTLASTVVAGTLTTLFVVGRPSPGVVTLLVLAGGCATGMTFPAFQAILPDLVPDTDLLGAVALSSAQWNLGRVIGPALAGLVIALGGYAWALGINTLSFLAVVAVLVVIHPPRPEPDHAEGILASIRSGARFVRGESGLRIVILALCLNTLCAAPFIALVPAMAIEVHHSGAVGTSILVTAQGLGAVTMGLMLGPLGDRLGPRRVMLTTMSLLPPLLTLYALAPSIGGAAVAIFAVGAIYLGALSSFTTIAQLRSPRALRGRVLSLNMVVLGFLYPLGSIVQGALADHWIGLPRTTVLAAAVMGGTLLLVRALRPGVTAPIDEPAVALAG
jgi:MFS family permease